MRALGGFASAHSKRWREGEGEGEEEEGEAGSGAEAEAEAEESSSSSVLSPQQQAVLAGHLQRLRQCLALCSELLGSAGGAAAPVAVAVRQWACAQAVAGVWGSGGGCRVCGSWGGSWWAGGC